MAATQFFKRFSHGFDESATALGIGIPTAKQWWAYARAWLAVEMRGT